MEKEDTLFYEYFHNWFILFKEPEVKPVTAAKYRATEQWIKKLAPNLGIRSMTRMDMQKLVNDYGKTHEIGTVRGFFHMIKACVEDAKYEGDVIKDPTYKIRMTSQKRKIIKHSMYLEKDQATKLMDIFKQHNTVVSLMFDFDVRTGLRFAELLGLTPADVDLEKGVITVNKSWLYKNKEHADFGETKNPYSHRTIPIDSEAKKDISKFMTHCENDEPIFVKAYSEERQFKPTNHQKYATIYDVTMNRILTQMCNEANVPRIGVHGLRHTHASLLFNSGISILSISRRLGHANTSTTEKVYVHLIDDQKQKDDDKMLKALDDIR